MVLLNIKASNMSMAEKKILEHSAIGDFIYNNIPYKMNRLYNMCTSAKIKPIFVCTKLIAFCMLGKSKRHYHYHHNLTFACVYSLLILNNHKQNA